MSAMTDYLEGELIKHIFRTGTFAKPTVLALALFTSDPTDAAGGTEVSGGSYARAQLNPDDANWAAPASGNGVTSNLAAITFPAPTGSWGTVTHWVLFDATTGGNRLLRGALAQQKNINTGDPAPSWPIGQFVVTFA